MDREYTTDRFQDVNRAYEVLSNPVLKSKYDMFGANGIGTSAASDEIKSNRVYSGSSSTSSTSSGRRRTSGSAAGGMSADGYGFAGIHSNPADIPGGYYHNGASSGYGRNVNPADVMDRAGRAKYGPHGGMVGDDLQLTMDIDFETAVFGGRETIWIDHLESCEYCVGSGVQGGSRVNYCETCGGAGFTVRVATMAFGSVQTQETCPSCKGSGKTVEEYCNSCCGQGMSERSKQIDVTIPAGVEGYTRLRIRGEGHSGPKGGPPGDLFIFLKVLPHPVFRRHGSSIHSNHTVDYIDAILGSKLETEVVGGEDVSLELPEGTQHEETIRLKGHGARSLIGESDARGDHVVTVNVEIPDEITEEEEEILLKLRELHSQKKNRKQRSDTEDIDFEDDTDDNTSPKARTTSHRPFKSRKNDRTIIDEAGTIRIDNYEVTYVMDKTSTTTGSTDKKDEVSDTTELEFEDPNKDLLQDSVDVTTDTEKPLSSTASEETTSWSPTESIDDSPFFADFATDTTSEFNKLKELLQAPIEASTISKTSTVEKSISLSTSSETVGKKISTPTSSPTAEKQTSSSKFSRTEEKKTSTTKPSETLNAASELDKLRELLLTPIESSQEPQTKKKSPPSKAVLLNTTNELDKLRELLNAPIVTSKKKAEAAAAAKAREIEAIKELEKLRQLLHEPLVDDKPAVEKPRTQAEINAANELRMLRELIQSKVSTSNNKTTSTSEGVLTERADTFPSATEKSSTGKKKKKQESAGSAAASGSSGAAMRVTAKATFDSNLPNVPDEQPNDTAKDEKPTAEVAETIKAAKRSNSNSQPSIPKIDLSKGVAKDPETTEDSEAVKSVKSLSSMGKFDDVDSMETMDAPEAALFAEVVEAAVALSDKLKEGAADDQEIDVFVDDAYSLSETIGPVGGSAGNDEDERSFAWEEITANSWRKNRRSKSSDDSDGHKFEEMLFSIFKL